MLTIIEHGGEHISFEIRWLLVASLAVVMISIAGLVHTLQPTREHQRVHRVGSGVMVISAMLIGLSGRTELDTLPMLAVLNLLLLAPVFAGFLAWLKSIPEDDR